MKNITFFSTLLFICCLVVGCSQSSKFESAAKKQMETTFKEMAKDPSSVKFSNMETVFSDDSLCIIHVDFSAKNAFGMEVKDRCEYIYISSNGKNYESYQEINNDEESVYVTPEKYDKNKKGTIYEPLDYEAGQRYLAAIFVNSNGREAGNREGDSFTIPVPTGTGSWNVMAYKDEFGEEDTDKYLALMGSGVFSNSVTTNSQMTAILYLDKDCNFYFKLIEYNSSIVKSDDSYDYRIKDSTGEVHEMTLYNSDESGQMSSSSSKNKEIIKKVLSKGGVITVAVRERHAYSTPDTYLFKLNVTGFEKAKTYL